MSALSEVSVVSIDLFVSLRNLLLLEPTVDPVCCQTEVAGNASICNLFKMYNARWL